MNLMLIFHLLQAVLRKSLFIFASELREGQVVLFRGFILFLLKFSLEIVP